MVPHQDLWSSMYQPKNMWFILNECMDTPNQKNGLLMMQPCGYNRNVIGSQKFVSSLYIMSPNKTLVKEMEGNLLGQ